MTPRRDDWIEVLAIAVIVLFLGLEWRGPRITVDGVTVAPCCEVTLLGR